MSRVLVDEARLSASMNRQHTQAYLGRLLLELADALENALDFMEAEADRMEE